MTCRKINESVTHDKKDFYLLEYMRYKNIGKDNSITEKDEGMEN